MEITDHKTANELINEAYQNCIDTIEKMKIPEEGSEYGLNTESGRAMVRTYNRTLLSVINTLKKLQTTVESA